MKHMIDFGIISTLYYPYNKECSKSTKWISRYNFITFFHFELYHWRGNLHLEIHFGWYAIQISHNLLILFSKPTPRVGFFSSATFLSCSHEVTVDALIRLPSLWSASLISGPPPPWSLIRLPDLWSLLPGLWSALPWSLIALSGLWFPFLVSDPPSWSLIPRPGLYSPSLHYDSPPPLSWLILFLFQTIHGYQMR